MVFLPKILATNSAEPFPIKFLTIDSSMGFNWFFIRALLRARVISGALSSKVPSRSNSIVFLGIFSALIGVLSTYIAIDVAISLVEEITNISPQILINGIKTSLITSFTGIIIMLISTILWFYFMKRHNLYVS